MRPCRCVITDPDPLLCEHCQQPMVCPAGTAERIAGLEEMNDQALTRAEQAESALASRPADPPALVALLGKAQASYREWVEFGMEEEGGLYNEMWQDVTALLSYPLPAAPPMTDTPQGDLRELARLHALWVAAGEANAIAETPEEHAATGRACQQARHDLICWPRLRVCRRCHLDNGRHEAECPAAPPQEDQ